MLFCLFPLTDLGKAGESIASIIVIAAVAIEDVAVFTVALARLRPRHVGHAVTH